MSMSTDVENDNSASVYNKKYFGKVEIEKNFLISIEQKLPLTLYLIAKHSVLSL